MPAMCNFFLGIVVCVLNKVQRMLGNLKSATCGTSTSTWELGTILRTVINYNSSYTFSFSITRVKLEKIVHST